jgi:Tfp pilus assembly protein PilN
MTAETLMLAGGVTSFALTLYWVRSRELREKYAVAWVLLASGLLLVGLFPGLVMRFADYAHLSYAAAVLFVALTLIYLFAFTVSVSLTHQYRRNVRLTQQVALLEERVRELERAAKEKEAAAAPGERSE